VKPGGTGIYSLSSWRHSRQHFLVFPDHAGDPIIQTRHTATHCHTLQHTGHESHSNVAHCNTLQHVAYTTMYTLHTAACIRIHVYTFMYTCTHSCVVCVCVCVCACVCTCVCVCVCVNHVSLVHMNQIIPCKFVSFLVDDESHHTLPNSFPYSHSFSYTSIYLYILPPFISTRNRPHV